MLSRFATALGVVCCLSVSAFAQTNCQPVPSGLAGWWPGDNHANDIAGTNNATLINGTSFDSGKIGAAFSFNGLANAVTNAKPGLSNILNSYTMEFWAWPTAARAGTPESTSGAAGIENQRYAIFPHNGRFGPAGSGVSVGTNGISVFEHGSAYLPSLLVHDATINGWTHVAVVYSNQQPSLFLNGTLARTGLFSARSSYPSTCFGDGADLGYGFYQGLLDEISIYDRALSSAEIQAIYAAGSLGKCKPASAPAIVSHPTNRTVNAGASALFAVTATGAPPLVYQWKFHGTNLPGATSNVLVLNNVQATQAGPYLVQVTNMFGSTNSATALLTVASPCVTLPADLLAWWSGEGTGSNWAGSDVLLLLNGAGYTNGRVGLAFGFDGSDDVAIASNSPSLNFGAGANFSIETWIRAFPHSTTFDLTSIVDKRDGSGRGYEFGLAGGRPNFRFSDSADSGSGFSAAGADLRDGSWHHLALTVSRNSSTGGIFYVDGAAVGTFDATTQPGSLSNAAPLRVGQNASGVSSPILGAIDELSFYRRALSASEVLAVYAAGAGGKCAVPQAPSIVEQPASQTAAIGSTVGFSVLAAGSPPLLYQWWFGSNVIAGATNTTLTLSNVQPSQAGGYSATVTNVVGFAKSTEASLTLTSPPAAIRIVSTNGPAGGMITLPVLITANGNENAFSFSLSYDVNRLLYLNAQPGPNLAAATLIPNVSSTNVGRLGLSLALPPGMSLPQGTQEVVRVNLAAAVVTVPSVTPVNFIDQPTPRALLSPLLMVLPTVYLNGTVSLSAATAYEADVFPRPGGDTNATLTDWLMLARYAARLDYPTNSSEFQRADCAPRATRGDGAIKVSDWVQAARYTSGVEPLTPLEGPTNEIPWSLTSSPSRLVSAGNLALAPGNTGSLPVWLSAQGNENALGFTLSINTGLVVFAGATLGTDATGAALYVNTNAAPSGLIGISLALPVGTSFAAGPKEVVKITLHNAGTAGSLSAHFVDALVPRDVSDSLGNSLPVSYSSGLITGDSLVLRISRQGTNIQLSWPLWASNSILQEAAGALPSTLGTWSNLTISPVGSNNETMIWLPVSPTNRFYRLYRP